MARRAAHAASEHRHAIHNLHRFFFAGAFDLRSASHPPKLFFDQESIFFSFEDLALFSVQQHSRFGCFVARSSGECRITLLA